METARPPERLTKTVPPLATMRDHLNFAGSPETLDAFSNLLNGSEAEVASSRRNQNDQDQREDRNLFQDKRTNGRDLDAASPTRARPERLDSDRRATTSRRGDDDHKDVKAASSKDNDKVERVSRDESVTAKGSRSDDEAKTTEDTVAEESDKAKTDAMVAPTGDMVEKTDATLLVSAGDLLAMTAAIEGNEAVLATATLTTQQQNLVVSTTDKNVEKTDAADKAPPAMVLPTLLKETGPSLEGKAKEGKVLDKSIAEIQAANDDIAVESQQNNVVATLQDTKRTERGLADRNNHEQSLAGDTKTGDTKSTEGRAKAAEDLLKPAVTPFAKMIVAENSAQDRAIRGAIKTEAGMTMAHDHAKINVPYDQASQLSAVRQTKGGPAGLPPVIEQVQLHLHHNAKSGKHEITLQLKPAELGRVDIKIDIGQDGKVVGKVTCDTPVALETLSKDARALERALQDAGLKADAGCLQFGLRDQGDANHGKNEGGKKQGGPFTLAVEEDGFVDAGTTDDYYVMPGRVNLRV
jgi:flagellar hook-length control protein FliK